MKFIDEAIITVASGAGGAGCVSFRREKFIPKGGPDGGDGGKGGDVVLVTDRRKRTLYQFHSRKHFKAKNGSPGQGRRKTGKNGADVRLEIPPGTVISEALSGELLKDLTEPGQTYIPARGGRGGKGNAHFKSAVKRAPRFAQPGEAGQTLRIKLELKLLADVGIIGLPNAGKSTLIRAISSAKPKTASYPFTTLHPNLGVVYISWGDPFVVADIPGLIQGAHAGAGLGTQFLRHIERTRILLHLIDIAAVLNENPLEAYRTVNRELALYGKQLMDKPQVVVLNKLDLPDAKVKAETFQAAVGDMEVMQISSLKRTGMEKLISRISRKLEEGP